MGFCINVNPIEVNKGSFNYSNMDSRYSQNTNYFTKDDNPYMIIAGEMHFAREPVNRWEETLLKMKALGLNAVSTYVFWNYHEEEKGIFDFSGNRDIHKFLSVCKKINMPCILRIGPWCHGEVVYGGLPKRINKLKCKRTNNPKYLAEVKDFWIGLYNQVKEYLDGEVVIGIQLENEYYGNISHLIKLREIAEEVGFRTPYFTMTAWPTAIPNNNFLPLFGEYPDAPWDYKKSPLSAANRFTIAKERNSNEIGTDIIKKRNKLEQDFSMIPYATCEVGPGNQVSQHRRPIIDWKAGYALPFAKLASGVNFLGYYMFVGGTNPNSRPMQESKRTGYPNNYPIIDYDFQAPISRYGVVRNHGHLLRLMHLMVTQFDSDFCTKQAFFNEWKHTKNTDVSSLKCSVRVDNNLSGYFFASTYDKQIKYNDFNDVEVSVTKDNKTITLPKINIRAESTICYPFNMNIANTHFDYILAQPIVKTVEDGKIHLYMMELDEIPPKCKVDNKEIALQINTANRIEDVVIHVLTKDEAIKLYYFNNRVYFIEGTVYQKENKIYAEKPSIIDIKDSIKLEKTAKTKLEYDKYLYSTGKRTYYKLTLPNNVLDDVFDIELKFSFDGLNLQVFSNGKLINDYFNIDRKFVMNLRDYKEYLSSSNELIIKTVPKTKHGVSNVYDEASIPLHSDKLELDSAKIILKEQFDL